jgi:outer membrane receptor protein involved in Fe transport
MIYATAAKGYRSGGSNSPGVVDNPLCSTSIKQFGYGSVPPTFRSDNLWSYEIGTKGSLLDSRLALQASVFYIDWRDIQTSVELPSCFTSFNTNYGRAISQGFDLQFAAVLTHDLRVSGSVAYTNAYNPVTEYGLPPGPGQPPPIIVPAGNKLGATIPWTATAALDYSRSIDPVWHGANGYVRLDYRWLDGKPPENPLLSSYDPLQGPYPDQAYSLFNAHLGIIHGGLDLSLFGENLTRSNPRFALGHAGTGPIEPLYYANVLQPLTVGIQALYRF